MTTVSHEMLPAPHRCLNLLPATPGLPGPDRAARNLPIGQSRKSGLSVRIRSLVWLVLAVLAGPAMAQDSGSKEQAGGPEWGTLTGKIVVEGELGDLPDEEIDKDQGTCLADGDPPKDDNLVVGPEGGLRDVFIMMFLTGDENLPIHPEYENPPEQPLVLDNIRCRFAPHALFVRTNQKLVLKNSDDVGHNCHIVTFGNEENVNLSQMTEVEVELKNSDKVPGNVVCDIHRWMDAVILVRDEPYAAISAEDGTFTIRNVPAGTWTFQFWHKKGGYLRDLQIEGHQPGRRGEIELTFEDGKTLDLGTMKIEAAKLLK